MPRPLSHHHRIYTGHQPRTHRRMPKVIRPTGKRRSVCLLGQRQPSSLSELPPRSWRTPLCGSTGRVGLVVDRGLHATGTVAASSIVEVDDPFHNGLSCFFSGFEMMTR